MMHFMTQSCSWLDNIWPNLYREAELQRRRDKKQAQAAPQPVVVRSLGITRNRTWPLDSPRDESPEREAAWAAFDRFAQNQNYAVVWSNEFFEILVPEQR
jgi:hypothetical protein